MKKSPLLGGITPQHFLREYWQKKPLLIRRAFPDFEPPVTRDALCALAARDDVESRLIMHAQKKWQLQRGPFSSLPGFDEKRWTLLVQGVNLHDDDADRLMQCFRFIPDARLDDLMISYASDGGGVGPHFDSYDVFLLQAQGKRRWRISAQKDLTLIEGMPLKILKNFEAEQEFVLEPGDMLYLPPHYAHDGVALGECMTYSVGFRAPSYQELGEAFLQFIAESIEIPGRYEDPDLACTSRPGEIGTGMLDRISTQLAQIRFSKDDIPIFLGEYLSEPKPQVYFDAPEKPLSPAKFAQAATKRGVALSRKTRMLYRGKHVFINGESFRMDREDKPVLALLANRRMLDGPSVAEASDDVMEALLTWYEDGWIELG